MKLRLEINQIIALILCIYVFIFTVPYFVWFKSWVFGYSAFLVYTLGVVLTFQKWKVDNYSLAPFIFYLLFCVFTYIPFRQHDSLDFSFLIPMFSVFILLYDKKVASKSFDIITNIFFLISFTSLACIVLYGAGLASPVTTVIVPGRVFDTYDVFLGTVVIPTQYFEISGFKLFRNHGWFQEPGHFAVYLSFILALQRNMFSGFKNKVMLLAMLTTFSAAGFLMLFVITALRLRANIKFVVASIVVLAFLTIAYSMIMSNEELRAFVEHWFLRKFETGDSVIASRRSGYIDTSMLNNDIAFIFGYGADFLKNQGIILSDYMAHIYKYGIVSFFFILAFWSCFLFIALRNKNTTLLIVAFLFLLTFLHRSFMVVGPIFIFFAWIALFDNKQYLILKTEIN